MVHDDAIASRNGASNGTTGLANLLADDRTLAVLDFPAVRELVAQQTTTTRGAAAARALTPGTDLAVVRLEQTATQEMRAVLSDGAFALPRTADVTEAVERAARGGALAPEELREIGFALAAADAAVRRIRGARAPVLHARCRDAQPLPEVAAAIDRAIGERGDVLDRASPALGRLRRNALHAQDDARDRCAAILRQSRYAKAIQEAIVTVREGRFVVPIKAEFSGMLPGVVHDTSASGHTLFVEPLDALDVNNRLRTLRLEEAREVARILAELSSLVGAKAERAQINLAVLVDLDLVLGRARVAHEMRAVAPRIDDEPHVDIRNGKHPLLGERAVTQSLRLDDDVRIIIVSGPNMGGKTVSLKMLGLFVAMAYCGMQLPAADGTSIGGLGFLGCDIGDEQSIAENASTFSAHLARLRTILASADSRSLVLVDEIASGTEPASGAALAVALLEDLLRRGVRGIVTTHSTELKLFGHATPHVQNASVRFDPHTYTPTYELDLNAPGRSLAFPLARTLGLDEEIVARAETLLSQSERDYDRALEELVEVRAQATLERDALVRDRATVARLEASARERAEALELQRRTFARQADDRLGRALRDFGAELERRERNRIGSARPKVTAGQAALLGRVLDDVHRELGVSPPATTPQAARPQAHGVAVRDRVFVDSLGSEGEVAEDYGDTVLVAIGAMKTVVPKSNVRVTQRVSAGKSLDRSRNRGGAGTATLEAATGARTELDVRGKRFVEAEPLVDRWIDESARLGLSPLRLIHGKGTGLLGRGLQQYLNDRAGVRDVRYGNADEGGSGVTVFELA